MTDLNSDRGLDELVIKLDAVNLIQDMTNLRGQVLDLLKLVPGDSVIDAGCGIGHLACKMAELVGNSGEVLGLDIDQDVLCRASERNECHWLSYQTCDITQIGHFDTKFDAATCIQVIEYLPDAELALSKIYDALKVGGRAVFCATDWDKVIWNSDIPSCTKQMLLNWRTHCRHPQLPRTFSSMLKTVGFTINMELSLDQVNRTFDASQISYWLANLIVEYSRNRALASSRDCEEWLDNFQSASTNGYYYFKIVRTLFSVYKLDYDY